MDTDLFSQIHTDKLMDDSCVLQLCFLFLVFCCFSQIGADFFADDRRWELCVLRVICGEKQIHHRVHRVHKEHKGLHKDAKTVLKISVYQRFLSALISEK